tara:strand:+ start:10092 stop:10376 length:285 start_codon:yes stop_codon:yes gene_type:complete
MVVVAGTRPGKRSKIKGLAQATVDIFLVWALYIHADHEEIFFSPLKDLRDLVKVEVRVSWAKHASVPEGKTWPFIGRDMVYYEESGGNFSLDAK